MPDDLLSPRLAGEEGQAYLPGGEVAAESIEELESLLLQVLVGRRVPGDLNGILNLAEETPSCQRCPWACRSVEVDGGRARPLASSISDGRGLRLGDYVPGRPSSPAQQVALLNRRRRSERRGKEGRFVRYRGGCIDML
jgi:hypothetical protein